MKKGSPVLVSPFLFSLFFFILLYLLFIFFSFLLLPLTSRVIRRYPPGLADGVLAIGAHQQQQPPLRRADEQPRGKPTWEHRDAPVGQVPERRGERSTLGARLEAQGAVDQEALPGVDEHAAPVLHPQIFSPVFCLFGINLFMLSLLLLFFLLHYLFVLSFLLD